MSGKNPFSRELPGELLDDERSWQGDHDPYLATLAHQGHLHPREPVPHAQRLEGPVDDGDPYLAQLTRGRRDVSDD